MDYSPEGCTELDTTGAAERSHAHFQLIYEDWSTECSHAHFQLIYEDWSS